MSKINMCVLGLVLALAFFAQSAQANLYTWEGLSAKDVMVSVEAELSISGSTLTLVLRNTSMDLDPPSPSLNPDDTLGSFYFDIYEEGTLTRPTLTYATATGDVWQGVDHGVPGNDIDIDPDPDLRASVTTGAWQFKTFTPSEPMPFAFGVGAVGNGDMNPYNFHGLTVDGLNYSIYAGNDIITESLDDMPLVNREATFTWTIGGVDPGSLVFGEYVGFGFGTAPDSFHIVPVPAAVILGILGFGVAGWKLRKFA